MTNKIVLITGCSSGVGLSTALAFGEKKYTVYASMRDLSKQNKLIAEAKKNNISSIHTIQLDVTKEESIKNCIQYIENKENKIDILINNAGAGFFKNTEQASEEEVKWVMDVNYLSVVRCCKAVLPIMRKQKSGHIINLSSVGGLVGQPFNELYCAAKFAVEGYTESLATYLTIPFGIYFTAIEPGGISTEFINSANKTADFSNNSINEAYSPILEKYMAGIKKRAGLTFQTPTEVAKVIWQVAESSNPPIRIRTSTWGENFCKLKTNADTSGLLLRNQVIEKQLQ